MKALTKEVAKELNGQKVYISATRDYDFMTMTINQELYKIFVRDDGRVFLMKPRATKKGMPLEILDNPTYSLEKSL